MAIAINASYDMNRPRAWTSNRGVAYGKVFKKAVADARGSEALPFMLGWNGPPTPLLYGNDGENYSAAVASCESICNLLQEGLAGASSVRLGDLPSDALEVMFRLVENLLGQRLRKGSRHIKSKLEVTAAQIRCLLAVRSGSLRRRLDFVPCGELLQRFDIVSLTEKIYGQNVGKWLYEGCGVEPIQIHTDELAQLPLEGIVCCLGRRLRDEARAAMRTAPVVAVLKVVTQKDNILRSYQAQEHLGASAYKKNVAFVISCGTLDCVLNSIRGKRFGAGSSVSTPRQAKLNSAHHFCLFTLGPFHDARE